VPAARRDADDHFSAIYLGDLKHLINWIMLRLLCTSRTLLQYYGGA